MLKEIIEKLTKEVEEKADYVRFIYEKQGLSESYELAFRELSDIRKVKMAYQFREKMGLDAGAVTPYCDSRNSI